MTELTSQHEGLNRRETLAGALAIACISLAGGNAQATPQEMASAISALTNGEPVRPGRVNLVMPELAENGNIVSLKVTVESPMTESDQVKAIHIFSELNPIATVARFHLTPRAGPKPTVNTNIRLADSQRVTAIAVMSDGSFWSGEAHVVITIAACIDGG